MWECRKCGRPVFFAERKQSLGFDWHPTCLRCEECGRRLNPGQHAEHKGVPYCHHPCYGALFGPQLFGHGTRNECHTSFGKVENRDGQVKRSHIEAKLKSYNQYYEGKPGELKHREANGRMILEGVLKIYWGVRNVIHLKEEDDQRTIAVRRRSTVTATAPHSDSDDEESTLWRDEEDTTNGWRTPQSPSSPFFPTTPQTPKLTPLTPTTPLTPRFPKTPSTERVDDCPLMSPTSASRENGTPGRNGNQSESKDSPGSKNSPNSPSRSKNSPSNEQGGKDTPTPRTPIDTEDFGETWKNSDFKTCRDIGTALEAGSGISRENKPPYLRSLSCGSGSGTSNNTSPSSPDIHNNNSPSSSPLCDSQFANDSGNNDSNEGNVSLEDQCTSRKAASKTGSTAIRRRPGRRMDKTKLKRRCSINGHFYLRETSSFTPPHGSPCSVWVTSLVTAGEVLNMLLEKYRVEMSTRNFALFVIKDNGERRRIRDEEYPLITRVMLGPHEEVARVFIVDAHQTPEISSQVAQFLNLSLTECRAILRQYEQEELRQILAVRQKYEDMAFYIQRRMKELRGV